jgi:hypothetical protein
MIYLHCQRAHSRLPSANVNEPGMRFERLLRAMTTVWYAQGVECLEQEEDCSLLSLSMPPSVLNGLQVPPSMQPPLNMPQIARSQSVGTQAWLGQRVKGLTGMLSGLRLTRSREHHADPGQDDLPRLQTNPLASEGAGASEAWFPDPHSVHGVSRQDLEVCHTSSSAIPGMDVNDSDIYDRQIKLHQPVAEGREREQGSVWFRSQSERGARPDQSELQPRIMSAHSIPLPSPLVAQQRHVAFRVERAECSPANASKVQHVSASSSVVHGETAQSRMTAPTRSPGSNQSWNMSSFTSTMRVRCQKLSSTTPLQLAGGALSNTIVHG